MSYPCACPSPAASTFLVNQTPADPHTALFLLKAQLLLSTCGPPTNWTITKSSNGTVFAAQGDVILTAADLATPGAWFVAQGKGWYDTNVVYYTQICFQTDGGRGLRVKVSPRAGFTGGTPGLVRTPSAVDEQYLLGGGTDASPTYTNYFKTIPGRMQGWVSEVNEGQWFATYDAGGSVATTLWFIDRPQPNPTGAGGNLLDAERIVFYAQSSTTCALASSLSCESTAPLSPFDYGQASALWGRCPPQIRCVYDTSQVLQIVRPGGSAQTLIYGEPTYPEAPFCYERRAADSGVALPGEVGDFTTVGEKGTSVYFRFGGQIQSVPEALNNVDPVTGADCPNGTFAVGAFLGPWGGAAVVL